MREKKEKEFIDVSLFQRARKAVDEVTSEAVEEIGIFAEEKDQVGSGVPGPEVKTSEKPERNLIISVRGLSKSYEGGAGEINVLHDVDFVVRRGDIVAVTGPSGCGKSTMLFILGLFLSPTSGTYHFDGKDVLAMRRSAQAEFRRKRVGFVFQSTDLLENSTVFENLEFPLIFAGMRRRSRKRRISEALELLHLGHRIKHSANLLSGGEKQRVAIARALVNRPMVILADEPTGQLDSDNTQQIMDHFEKIVEDGETSVVVVTHDPRVAARCGRVCTLVDGKIYYEH